MKEKALLIPLLLFSVGWGVAQPSKLSSQNKIKMEVVQQIELQENKFVFKKASDIAVSDQYFVISSRNPASVIKYDFSGHQILEIGRSGRGPFEYVTPSKIEIHDNRIFVWDSNLLKMNIYTSKGKKNDELSEFSSGIADFKVAGKNVALYLSGKKSRWYIKSFEYARDSSTEHYGERNDVHDLLMMYKNSGGLAFLNTNQLLYGSPASDAVHLRYLDTQKDSTIYLDEEKFNIQEGNIPEYRPANIERVTEFLFNNSRLSGIHVLKDFIVIELQVGKVSDQSRTNILHIYDKSFNKIDTISVDFSFLENYGEVILSTFKNTLYYLNNYSSKIEAEKAGRILTGWKLSEVNQ